MAILNLFKLEKLQIKAFKDEERKAPETGSLEVMFNPESYTVSYANEYSKKQAIGSSGNEVTFSKGKNAVIAFKFIFDGTGVADSGDISFVLKKKDVYKEVQNFIALTISINGKIHEPNFLKIKWGDLNFRCRLENVQISYTLFDEHGRPLRAELDATFIGDLKTSKRLRMENKSSPDLTHKRIVKAYDTLPLMCEEIYGSGLYYLQVAKANRLDDFRNLIPGQELFFPPLKK